MLLQLVHNSLVASPDALGYCPDEPAFCTEEKPTYVRVIFIFVPMQFNVQSTSDTRYLRQIIMDFDPALLSAPHVNLMHE